MVLNGYNFSKQSAQVYLSKKNGMIKEEMPNFRLDLTIMEIGEKRLTVLF